MKEKIERIFYVAEDGTLKEGCPTASPFTGQLVLEERARVELQVDWSKAIPTNYTYSAPEGK